MKNETTALRGPPRPAGLSYSSAAEVILNL